MGNAGNVVNGKRGREGLETEEGNDDERETVNTGNVKDAKTRVNVKDANMPYDRTHSPADPHAHIIPA